MGTLRPRKIILRGLNVWTVSTWVPFNFRIRYECQTDVYEWIRKYVAVARIIPPAIMVNLRPEVVHLRRRKTLASKKALTRLYVNSPFFGAIDGPYLWRIPQVITVDVILTNCHFLLTTKVMKNNVFDQNWKFQNVHFFGITEKPINYRRSQSCKKQVKTVPLVPIDLRPKRPSVPRSRMSSDSCTVPIDEVSEHTGVTKRTSVKGKRYLTCGNN